MPKLIDVDNTEPTDYMNDKEPDYAEYSGDELSDCCSAMIYADSDVCSDCKEHCGIQGEDEDTPEQMNNWLRQGGW